MRNTITVNISNIEAIMEQCGKSIRDAKPQHSGLLLPIAEPILNRDRYCGKGRPRKSNYDWKEIDWYKTLDNKKA